MPRISQAEDVLGFFVSGTWAQYTLSTFLLVPHSTAKGTNFCFVINIGPT